MSERPAHEIVIASTEAEIQQCYKIRIDVFTHEQGFPIETELDHLDPIATHFLLRLTPSFTPVGVIRGSKSSETGYYKLSRLAVLKDYRQFKFGREFVEALHKWVQADAREADAGQGIGSAKVVCHSQIPVKGFYAKFGYISEGDEFDEDGDPHQKMVLKLPLE
ncbi:acyl-CoA N-acyltransferase [Lentinula detonsa]|uniref:Acyl-CoA N-acyltransferase n=1 Tax=Lentinula detonsa TaxID=2804962 RepID=A0AA38UP96_9AGAR|nr:acyl-CoA N-acyltransferase [Lentinula detonsa]